MCKARMSMVVIAALLLCVVAIPVGAQTKVIIWHPQLEQDFVDYFTGIVKRFNASQSDVVVEVQTVAGGWDVIREKLIAVASGVQQPPTIVWTHTDSNWELESGGFFEPIPDQVLADLNAFDRFLGYKEWYRNENGRHTRLPYSMGNGVMYYNKDMLAEAGMSPNDLGPSWEKFKNAARRLTRTNAEGVITQAGYDPTDGVPYLWMDMIYQQGSYMWTENGQANFNSLEGRWAADYLVQELFRFNRPYGQNLQFQQNAAATQYGWGWRYRRWSTDLPNLNIGVIPTPTLTGDFSKGYGRMNVEDFFMVFALAPATQKQAAWKFASYIYNDPEIMIRLSLRGGIPISPSLWRDERIMNHPVNRVMAQTLPYSAYPGEIGVNTARILTDHLLKVVRQTASPSQALQQATDVFNGTVAGRPLHLRERLSAF